MEKYRKIKTKNNKYLYCLFSFENTKMWKISSIQGNPIKLLNIFKILQFLYFYTKNYESKIN